MNLYELKDAIMKEDFYKTNDILEEILKNFVMNPNHIRSGKR